MTAIVCSYVTEGFVIGADGLRQDFYDTITDHAQKIFPVEQSNLTIAYAWAGSTRLEYADRAHFDFIEETVPAMARLRTGISAEQFARELASGLVERVNAHNGDTPIPMIGRRANEIVRGLFVGYWNNDPFRTEVSFLQENGVVVADVDTIQLKFPDFRVFSGSQIVLDETDVDRCTSLNRCVDTVREYIQQCAANTIDPYCKSIGGHIHIATITPEKFSLCPLNKYKKPPNFRWIVPPIQ